MKVLLVGNYLPDGQQSMQIYASMMQEELRRRGHEVRLLRPPAVLGAHLSPDSPWFKWAGYVDKFALFRAELSRTARMADIVHICDHSNAMYVPLLKRRPHLVTCHDVLAIRSAMGHFPENRVGATGRIFQRLIARGLRRAQSVLCVSRKTRDDLEQYVGIAAERLQVVPNALPWPYRPLSRNACGPLLQGLGIGAEDTFFLHVGGDHWYKNRPGVIAIFAQLRRMPQYAGARLVMAGAPLSGELHALARQHQVSGALVEASGVSHETLQALYSRALALLFPSLEEGFGWPILEAQACGCPVATTNRPPMSEVADGAAVLIDPRVLENPGMLEKAAQSIADALADSAAMRAAGLRNADAHSVDIMMDKCEERYRECVRASSAWSD